MKVEPTLSLSGVSKSYGAVKALRNVSFDVQKGEVHAILGENGAGKSTTLKIISGGVEPDEGTVKLSGHDVKATAQSHGDVSMVHQELAVFPNMSVAENIFLDRMPRMGIRIDSARMNARASELLMLFGLQLDPRMLLGELTTGQQQIIEILRAIERNSSLLILDEPTSGLNNTEAETLMGLIKHLRAKGHTVLYVSHRLHEVLDIADKITVLRDGQYVDTLVNDNLTEDDLIRRMVGRDLALAEVAERNAPAETPVALAVDGLSLPGKFENMSLDVRQGEIVGVFGLEGSGAEDFSHALYGIELAIGGRIELLGKPVPHPAPAEMMLRGMSYLNGNRKQAGLYMDRSIADNVSAPVLDRVSRFGLVNSGEIRARANADIKRFAIRVPSADGRPGELSGGNQQKVMLSACFASAPEVVVLNEPTRGVDVGAKAELHEAVRREAATGKSFLVFSSDLPELLRLVHRIVVMRSRRRVGEVAGRDMSEEAVMALAAGRS